MAGLVSESWPSVAAVLHIIKYPVLSGVDLSQEPSSALTSDPSPEAFMSKSAMSTQSKSNARAPDLSIRQHILESHSSTYTSAQRDLNGGMCLPMKLSNPSASSSEPTFPNWEREMRRQSPLIEFHLGRLGMVLRSRPGLGLWLQCCGCSWPFSLVFLPHPPPQAHRYVL